ncbi:hypothetical protein [Paenibacillus pini]|uniref:Uncharacterized protein n=1 Tax=Paenibacillus pini JCM 16418 TaxID=1236976 RepID=W7YYV1_9BACL|nr:hypothetical protein [Paenibacillus pini]GAF07574.1 hypothetical protein JCM16418_1599 [Paenibacillus pini JCM 16418]
MTQQKKLTLIDLNRFEKELDKTKKISILDNKYEVNIHTTFKDSDIEDLLHDFRTIIEKLSNTQNVELRNVYSIYLTLILRQFTDIPITEENEIVELIRISKVLKNKGITNEVFNEIPQDQLDYLTQKVKKSSDALNQLLKDTEVENGYTEPKAVGSDSEKESS